MRAAVYARVSSDKQRDNQTIASQLTTLPAFVAAREWSLTATYVDDGKTAKAGHLDAREGFQRLLRDMAAGAFDVVVVIDQDRLTRSEDLKERGEVLGAFQRAGVKIAIASTGQILDLASSIGDLLSGLYGFFSAEENRKRRERCARGRKEALLNGRPMGWLPWGYTFDGETDTWGEHAERAPLVREILARVASGESTEAVAADLERRGISRHRSKHWTRERVYAIVRSPTYRGEWLADKKGSVTIHVPRLVDDETWYAAQEQIMRARSRGLRRTRRVYLLEGIADCATCGAPIHIHHGRGRYTYYVCSRRKQTHLRRETGPCTQKARRTDEVDARVWEKLSAALNDQKLVDQLAAHHGEKTDTATAWAADLAQYEQRLERLHNAESAILDRFRRGLISERGMDGELQRNVRERKMLTRQIETARQQGASTAIDVRLTLEEMRDKIGTATLEQRREIVQALACGERATLGKDSVEFVALLGDVAGVGYGGVSAYQNAVQNNCIILRLVA